MWHCSWQQQIAALIGLKSLDHDFSSSLDKTAIKVSEILKLLNILRILIEIELYISHAGPNAQTPIWAEISLSLLILSIWTHQIGHPHKANPNVWILVHCYPLDQRGWQNYRTVMTQSGNFAHTNKLHTVYTKLN